MFGKNFSSRCAVFSFREKSDYRPNRLIERFMQTLIKLNNWCGYYSMGASEKERGSEREKERER